MIATNQIQTIASIEEPVVSLFLNTENPNPSRHPRVPADIHWLHKSQAALEESLADHEAKGFEKAFVRVKEFLKDRHPQEKALAIFVGHDTWTVIPLETPVQNAIHWGRPAVGQLVAVPRRAFALRHCRRRSQHGAILRVLSRRIHEPQRKAVQVDESQWKRTDVGHIATEAMRKGHGPDRDLYDHRLDAQYERLSAGYHRPRGFAREAAWFSGYLPRRTRTARLLHPQTSSRGGGLSCGERVRRPWPICPRRHPSAH